MDANRTLTRRALLQRTAVAGGALALGSLSSCTSSNDRKQTRRRASSSPNIVVVLADDMRYDEAEYMPNVSRSLVGEGTSFVAARHNISMCSPARAGFLTGQYSMRHGVRSQRDPFVRDHDGSKTIPVWMQGAGYDTGIIGKYFTGVEGHSSPPGWNVRRQLDGKVQAQYGFTVWDGSKTVAPKTDQTRYLRDEVMVFLRSAREPFFLWFTPTANHSPYEAPPGHEDDLASLEWPDLREDDVSDKPSWIQSMPPITDAALAKIRHNQRLRIRELLGLDDTIAEIFKTLDARGVLENTVVMFSSDNGLLQGEHRVSYTKNMPYEGSVRVPCFLRAPGLASGVITQPAHMAIDLTATCVDVAGATPDLALDGVSLLEIAANPHRYDDRRLLYDRDDRDNGLGVQCPPADGVFTARRKLVRYKTTPPTYELYDLEGDPGELQNVAEDPSYAAERIELEADLDKLLAS